MTKLDFKGKCILKIKDKNGKEREIESNNSLTNYAIETMIRNMIFSDPTNGGATQYSFLKESDDPSNYVLAAKNIDSIFITDKKILKEEITDLNNHDIDSFISVSDFKEVIMIDDSNIMEPGGTSLYSLNIEFTYTNTTNNSQEIKTMGLLINHQYMFSILNFESASIAPSETLNGNYIMTFVVSR